MACLYPNQRFKYLIKLTCLILTSSSALSSTDDKPTAYEVLGDYNFPMGILPIGVTGYDLDKSTGKFSAYLNGSCSFPLEGSYKLSYRSTIEGYISQGKLSNLEGVKVQLFFLWVNIVEVDRIGDNLFFSLGVTQARFPLDNFGECPQCGCGFICVNGQASKLRTNPFGTSYY